jgi:hypothetical protein
LDNKEDEDMLRNRILRIICLFVITILFIPQFSQVSSGDIFTHPSHPVNQSQGKLNDSSSSVYLEYVNITIDLYKDSVFGKGIFTLNNPSNQSADLTLFFDPSYYAESCTIKTYQETIDVTYDKLEESYYKSFQQTYSQSMDDTPYDLPQFNINITPNSSLDLQISWETTPFVEFFEEYNDQLDFEMYEWVGNSVTDWGNSYFIISKSSWPEPIKKFVITFISHHEKFDNPEIRLVTWMENDYCGAYFNSISDQKYHETRYTDHEGNLATRLSMYDWHENDTLINYDGIDEYSKVKEFDYGKLVILILICSIPIISIIAINKLVKRRKR